MDELNHYERLGVTGEVDGETLRAIFRKQAATLHVDRFVRFDVSADSIQKLQQVFISINESFQVLSDPEQRREYDLELEHGGEPVNSERDLGALLRSEQLTKEALRLIANGKARPALSRLEEALQINRDDGLAQGAQIYANYLIQAEQGSPRALAGRARDQLRHLLSTYQAREEPYLYLGRLLVALEDWKGAEEAFKGSLQVNPHFVEASSALRHVQRQLEQKSMSRESKKSGGGKLFQRWKK